MPCIRTGSGKYSLLPRGESKGELSGAFAFGGEGEQARRLREDGVVVENGKVDLDQFRIQIDPVTLEIKQLILNYYLIFSIHVYMFREIRYNKQHQIS